MCTGMAGRPIAWWCTAGGFLRPRASRPSPMSCTASQPTARCPLMAVWTACPASQAQSRPPCYLAEQQPDAKQPALFARETSFLQLQLPVASPASVLPVVLLPSRCMTVMHLQAQQLKAVALRIRDKFTTAPSDSSAWARRHAEQQAREESMPGLGPQQLPEAMPSLDYQLLWRADDSRAGSSVSVWRPVGPPGFKPVGHVAVLGPEKPVEPVQVSMRLVQQQCVLPATLPA